MHGPSLVVWGGGSARALRARPLERATVVAWPGAEPGALAAASVPFRTLEDVIGPEGLAAAEAAGKSFARVWARLPLVEGRSFRDLVLWRGESLLWTAESFLRTRTAGAACARTAELCLRLLAALRPSEIDAFGLPAAEAALLARAATASGVLFHGEGGPAKPLVMPRPAGRPCTLRRLFRGVVSRRPALAGSGSGEEAPLILFLVARADEQIPLAPLLRTVRDDLRVRTAVVAKDALPRFGTGATRRAGAEAERRLREQLRTLRGTPALAASYAHRGIGFADLAASDLDALFLGRLPDAVRTLEQAVALVEAARPALLVLTLSDRDDRRTLGMAAAAAAVPWATLRPLASDEEEPDRADGGPRPLAALVLEPGGEAAVLAGLREAARDRVTP